MPVAVSWSKGAVSTRVLEDAAVTAMETNPPEPAAVTVREVEADGLETRGARLSGQAGVEVEEHVAEMVACPVATPVATPLLLIVATLVGDDFQVTLESICCELPS